MILSSSRRHRQLLIERSHDVVYSPSSLEARSWFRSARFPSTTRRHQLSYSDTLTCGSTRSLCALSFLASHVPFQYNISTQLLWAAIVVRWCIPSVATRLTYWNQGRWREAEELFVQVMETRKRVLGEEHPDTLTSMNNLAWTWNHQGRHDEAMELMAECVERTKGILGVNAMH
jgi:hypothetical protein